MLGEEEQQSRGSGFVFCFFSECLCYRKEKETGSISIRRRITNNITTGSKPSKKRKVKHEKEAYKSKEETQTTSSDIGTHIIPALLGTISFTSL